jgi:Leucine-rich repeat (LRR) protein
MGFDYSGRAPQGTDLADASMVRQEFAFWPAADLDPNDNERGIEEFDHLYLRENRITGSGERHPLLQEILGRTRLGSVALDKNMLTAVPAVIFSTGLQTASLTSLSLGNNALREISDAIGQLKALQTLVLSNNQISEIPSSIASLKHLTVFSAVGNRLDGAATAALVR